MARSSPSPSSLAHFCTVSAVILTNTTAEAESRTPTPPSVTEAFMIVLVGFWIVWMIYWRLPTMVAVLEVSICRVQMSRKERKHKKTQSSPMVFRTTTEKFSTLGLKSRSLDYESESGAFWLSNAVSTLIYNSLFECKVSSSLKRPITGFLLNQFLLESLDAFFSTKSKEIVAECLCLPFAIQRGTAYTFLSSHPQLS